MPESAVVILGAGASHDLIPRLPNPATTDEKFTPLLTAELFGDREIVHDLLQKYEGVKQLASTIAYRIQSKSLEETLKEMSASSQPRRLAQMRQVPLYLQDLFWDISWHYTTEPVNYTHLIDELFEAFGEVAFITLNYDLFMETALGLIRMGTPTCTLDSYAGDNWLLVKLHGSANWGRRLTGYEELPDVGEVGSESAYLRIVTSFASEENLGPITPLAIGLRWQAQSKLYYPAITVPIAGKYHYMCPPEHVERLCDLLGRCRHVLAIGTSGRDRDLTDLLKGSLPQDLAQFVIVGKGTDTSEAAINFSHSVPRSSGVSIRDSGFSDFLLTGGLTDFCQGALRHTR